MSQDASHLTQHMHGWDSPVQIWASFAPPPPPPTKCLFVNRALKSRGQLLWMWERLDPRHSSSLHINGTPRSAFMEINRKTPTYFSGNKTESCPIRKVQRLPSMLEKLQLCRECPVCPWESPTAARPKLFKDLGMVLSPCGSLPKRAEHIA